MPQYAWASRNAVGLPVFDWIHDKLTEHLRELEAHKATTLAADFPPAS